MNRRQARDQIAELARELTAPRRPNPVLAAYRWRYELAAAAVIPFAAIELEGAVGPVWFGVVVAAVMTTVWHWPAARRFCAARIRTVIVQHRLRTAFARARICTLDGRLPAILWTSPSDTEIRVWLACPAGIDAERVSAYRRVLAAACFANDVTVVPHPKYSNMIVLSVWLRVR